jgi:hypothetical protein
VMKGITSAIGVFWEAGRASGESSCGPFPSGSRGHQSRNATTGGAASKGRRSPRSRERNRRNADWKPKKKISNYLCLTPSLLRLPQNLSVAPTNGPEIFSFAKSGSSSALR